MNDFRSTADLVEIQAPQAEFTDAVMMRDGHRPAGDAAAGAGFDAPADAERLERAAAALLEF
ncbi:hypothetical protein AB0F71_27710 [Kitasatospora sp. NPDC028055]|uniref:hypothetical protein n=1 Tax=Kitasatospora sp. NPDC028055 TaxID=3155653 RepID=UPI0033D03F02